MKNLILILMILPVFGFAGGLGTSHNMELLYLYITLITLAAVIIITDQFLKYVFRKMREREELQKENEPAEGL